MSAPQCQELNQGEACPLHNDLEYICSLPLFSSMMALVQGYDDAKNNEMCIVVS